MQAIDFKSFFFYSSILKWVYMGITDPTSLGLSVQFYADVIKFLGDLMSTELDRRLTSVSTVA